MGFLTRTQVGTHIVNDSLIFYYDMNNKQRSFKGKPTTNLFAGSVNDYSGWDNNNTDHTYYDPLPEVKFFENTTSTVGFYTFKDSTLDGTSQYTQSIYVKPVEREYLQITPSTGFPISQYANYYLNGEGSITGTGSAKATITLIKFGRYSGWYRCTYTETSNSSFGRMVYAIVNSSTATRLQAYAGTIGSGLLILDPQLEVSSFATPFVDGTRSDTQAIIDLTGTYTPAATSLTYNSDNTFSFGGPATSNRITVGIGSYPIDASDPFSIECWIKIPNGADWQDSITFGGNSGTGIVSRGGYGGAIGLWTVDGGSLDGRLKFTIRTSGTQHAGSVDASYDQWYHLIGTYNGLDATTNNMSFYVNGIWDSSVTFTDQGDAFDQQNWIVGGNNALGGTNGGYVTADIPIVRIYSKALSAAEVKQNFIAQRKQFGL